MLPPHAMILFREIGPNRFDGAPHSKRPFTSCVGAEMDLGLSGRVAIVAAASKGLGRAVAEQLACEGANVAVCARTARDLELTAALIQKVSGREVFWRPVDVADQASIVRFVDEVEARFSRIDICVTNTGGPPALFFFSTSHEN